MLDQFEIRTPAGVELRPISMSPSPDYMAGADGKIYSRLRHKGFGRWKYVDWHPVTSRRRRSRVVVIEHDGKKVSVALARIICTAFHGPPPGEDGCVVHLNGNQDDNRAENLAWDVSPEHSAGAIRERHPARRLTPEERAHLRWAVGNGLCSQRQAARVLGLALSTVQGVLHEHEHGRGHASERVELNPGGGAEPLPAQPAPPLSGEVPRP